MDRQARQAGNPLSTALVGIQKIAQALEGALDKAGRWQYFAPFFPEFAGNNNPSSLVTNPYANLSRAGLATRGLRLDSENPPALAVLERVRAGIDDPLYRLVAKDLARRDDDAPYRRLADEVAAAFSDEGFAAEKVEDFLATSRALLGRRSSEGFSEAFLTHLVGCCIAEPGSYALELDSLCAMDPAAYSRRSGRSPPTTSPRKGVWRTARAEGRPASPPSRSRWAGSSRPAPSAPRAKPPRRSTTSPAPRGRGTPTRCFRGSRTPWPSDGTPSATGAAWHWGTPTAA